LFIAWLASRLRGARFVIDWHNLSHTIAAVRVGERHRAVKSIARSERRWAKRASAHLTVSKALAEWLSREYKLKAAVVYDRPGDASLAHQLPTRRHSGNASPRTRSWGSSQPPIVVCPTSWTPDETSICCSWRWSVLSVT
jgi:beta-1,4-mannosyltransferase